MPFAIPKNITRARHIIPFRFNANKLFSFQSNKNIQNIPKTISINLKHSLILKKTQQPTTPKYTCLPRIKFQSQPGKRDGQRWKVRLEQLRLQAVYSRPQYRLAQTMKKKYSVRIEARDKKPSRPHYIAVALRNRYPLPFPTEKSENHSAYRTARSYLFCIFNGQSLRFVKKIQFLFGQ